MVGLAFRMIWQASSNSTNICLSDGCGWSSATIFFQLDDLFGQITYRFGQLIKCYCFFFAYANRL